MKYLNLLGEEIDTEEEHKKHLKVNPMVRAQGNGPKEFKCKHCKFFYRKEFSKTYFKCEFRGDTNGTGTDHKANWPTCGKFILDGMSIEEAKNKSYPDGGGKYVIQGEFYTVHCDEYHMHSFKCLSKC